ncbi:MAG TPA: MbcA/ParS/Xre antitoxin family protein [Candidatus Baltobacteraceae bacterium]|nr:MbcA/ParS/Xre antitoxin family protein [Candidatus Baltobacteraceae bacterium]
MARVSAGTKTPEISLSERLSGPALEAFARIAGHWDLTTAEQRTLLGGIAESTFFKYLKNPKTARLSADTLERISHLVGIFKSINVLLPRAEAADSWMRRSNDAALFKGRSALDYVLSGRFEDLIAVRHYLDAMRGW